MNLCPAGPLPAIAWADSTYFARSFLDKRGSNFSFLMKRLNHEIVRLNISSLGSAIAINHQPPFVSPGFLLRGQRFNKTDQATSLDPHQMTDIQIFYF